MPSQKDLDDLAEQIREGLAKHGVHVLEESELSTLGDSLESGQHLERRLHLENFARLYGFKVHYSTSLQVAIFRKLEEGDAGGAVDTKG